MCRLLVLQAGLQGYIGRRWAGRVLCLEGASEDTRGHLCMMSRPAATLFMPQKPKGACPPNPTDRYIKTQAERAAMRGNARLSRSLSLAWGWVAAREEDKKCFREPERNKKNLCESTRKMDDLCPCLYTRRGKALNASFQPRANIS